MDEVDTRAAGRTKASAGGMRSPWTAWVIAVAALLTGGILNAHGLARTAAAQSPGWQRTVAVAVTDFAERASNALWLDRPRRLIDDIRSHGTADTGDGTPVPTVVFAPTAEQPARLSVAGDSLVGTFGPALVERAAKTGVVDARWEVSYSSGLTRPQIFDWPAHLAEELAGRPAEIMVFMIGANDAQPIQVDDAWASFPDEPWLAEYRSRVGATMDLLTDRVATVYWVGQPIARSATQSARIEVMNDIYRSEAASRPAVRYVDAWTLFTGEDGGYADYLEDEAGRLVLMRDPDGVHLSPAGADFLAAETMRVIRLDWAIP